MSRLSTMRAVLAAAGVLGFTMAGGASAQEAFSIDANALTAAGCFGQSACVLDQATLSTGSGGVLAKKDLNGATGFGVSGGSAGSEIDIGEKLRVEFGDARSIVAIKILFLYNGPEFGDKAEKAQVTADGTTYTLATRNDADDAAADWSGPGTVTKCGATTASGTGCFIVTDPFPADVIKLEFTAVAGGPPYPASGAVSNNSDYSIGYIDVAASGVIELQDCADAEGCPVASVGGTVAFSLNSVQATNPGGSTEALVIPVRLPDCRYIPHVCLNLLPPVGDTAATDDAARAILISLGVIKPLDPSGPNKLNPAAQQLNVKPLLPAEVTALFDASSTPPNGLPSLYVASRWRGQSTNDYWFDGFFFKTDTGVVFSDVFEGLIDVSVLTGQELGCFANTGNLLAWDVITTVSELARGVGGRHLDTMINVGCINPTKVAGTRLSLYSVNFEIAPDTYGPTIKSFKPKVTVNNDAVFARLAQSLWHDIGETRASYACKQADPLPAGGVAPLSSTVCKKLASLWAIAEFKVNLCVDASFYPASAYRTWICGLARDYVAAFEAALPVAAAGPDAYNRLGELKARVDVFQHVWDERFLNSQKPGGFCRERGTCAP
jgi:hypothetical protein